MNSKILSKYGHDHPAFLRCMQIQQQMKTFLFIGLYLKIVFDIYVFCAVYICNVHVYWDYKIDMPCIFFFF